jgi:hypothetical protein
MIRAITALVICLALLWLADVVFFKSHYSNRLWAEAQYQGHKLNYEVQRLIRF